MKVRIKSREEVYLVSEWNFIREWLDFEDPQFDILDTEMHAYVYGLFLKEMGVI